jgi:hypothetical protein
LYLLKSLIYKTLLNSDGHRLTAINRLTGTLNSAAPFSIAAASLGASTLPSQTAFAAILYMRHLVGLGGSGFFAIPAVSGRETSFFNPLNGEPRLAEVPRYAVL